eukprot:6279742-Pyramimonas_sp.AAC.1
MNACAWWMRSRIARARARRSHGRARGANNYHVQVLAVTVSYNMLCTYVLVWLNARFTYPTANDPRTCAHCHRPRRARPGS